MSVSRVSPRGPINRQELLRQLLAARDPADIRARLWAFYSACAAADTQLVRLDELTTTRGVLDLATLLADDATVHTDLFAHVVAWQSRLYLEDGLHQAVRTALSGRHLLHARVHTVT